MPPNNPHSTDLPENVKSLDAGGKRLFRRRPYIDFYSDSEPVFVIDRKTVTRDDYISDMSLRIRRLEDSYNAIVEAITDTGRGD